MWKELISKITNEVKFSSAANDQQLLDVESVLGVQLPDELASLLRQSNGVLDEYQSDLIWNTERIKNSNIEFRTKSEFRDLYMPFDHLLFFGDSGDGNQYAYPIQNGEIRRPDIFVWNHEEDSRSWVAPSLEQLLELSLNGELET